MTQKEKKKRAADIVAALKEKYPSALCALEYDGDPWRLLVMGRLSAQCTDARVNVVCRDLFARYPDVYAMAAAESMDNRYALGIIHISAHQIADTRVLRNKVQGLPVIACSHFAYPYQVLQPTSHLLWFVVVVLPYNTAYSMR